MNSNVTEGRTPRMASLAGLCLTALLSWVLPAAGDEDPENDYGRAQIGGNRGPIRWESLLHGDGLEGWRTPDAPGPPPVWSRDGDALVRAADGAHPPRIVQGDSTWVQYELKVQGTQVRAGTIEVLFGISEDGKEFYSLNYLSGWKALAISRRDENGFTKLDVVNLIMHWGHECDIVLAVRGRSITSYVDGELVNRLTVDEPVNGAVGFVTWGKRAHGRFRDPKIRHYN